MKFAFLRLIELFYLYVFPIPTPRGINAVSLRRKLKDSVGSQRALLKKTSTLACQELLLHSLQKQLETTLKSLRSLGSFRPVGGPLTRTTGEGKAVSARSHIYGPGGFSPFPESHQNRRGGRCLGPDWPCPPGSFVRCCASGRRFRPGLPPPGAAAFGSTGTWPRHLATGAPRWPEPRAIAAGSPRPSRGPQSRCHRPLRFQTRAPPPPPTPPPPA